MIRLPLKALRLLAAGIAALMFAALAAAQSYPSKSVRWLVGFPPGGGSDVLARVVSAQLSTDFGQQFYVDNRPGATGMIAAELGARAAPDGYTLLTADVAILAFDPALYANVRYDPAKDFQPIGLMARFPLVIATNPASGIHSIQQLVADNKRSGAGFDYGSAGVGTPHHLAMELLISTSGVKAQHIPFKGDAPALQALMGNQLPVAVLSPSVALPSVKEGKLVALAVSSERRMPQLPDVPTLKELGYAPAGVYAWQGLVAPKGTPRPVVDALSQKLKAALAMPVVLNKLSELGMEPIASSPDEMARYVASERAFWGPLIKERGIRAD